MDGPAKIRSGSVLGVLFALTLLAWAAPVAAQPAGGAATPPSTARVADDPDAEDSDAQAAAPLAAEPPDAATAAAAAPDAATAAAEAPDAATAEVPDAAAAAPTAAPAGAPDAASSASALLSSMPATQPADPRSTHGVLALPSALGASLTARALASAASTAHPRIGAMADVGLPDGATVSIVYRPTRWLRAHAGLSHNLISLGERAGVTLTPGWWASPTLSLEVGQFAEGNANPLARAVSGDATVQSAVLDRVGYRYANAHLGVELGRRWFTFYLHAGVSRIAGTVHNLDAETMSTSSGTTSVSFSADPSVQVWTVSARVGFVVYLAK